LTIGFWERGLWLHFYEVGKCLRFETMKALVVSKTICEVPFFLPFV
jgi:hypothetical protein